MFCMALDLAKGRIEQGRVEKGRISASCFGLLGMPEKVACCKAESDRRAWKNLEGQINVKVVLAMGMSKKGVV